MAASVDDVQLAASRQERSRDLVSISIIELFKQVVCAFLGAAKSLPHYKHAKKY